jgi:type IV secretion system protein VirD4
MEVMNQDFIDKQRRKFNLRYDFHDVFTEHGWHGIQESSNPDVIPYEKYTLDGGARPVLVNATFNFPIITSIDNQKVKLKCRNAFDCFVHLVMNGNEFEAAQQVANLIPDNNEPVVVNVLVTDNAYDGVKALPLVISPIESESYPDKSIQRLVPSDVHGSAQWKTVKEIRASELISDTGIPLGKIQNEHDGFEKISYTGGKHLLTIAPSGTGKNSAVQIPVLLQYDAPIFCIDAKGENALVTARYRKEVMGHDVVVINPFGVYAERFEELGIKQVGFNPLASLNPDEKDFVTQVNEVCQLLIEPQGNDPFWSDAPRELVSCLIMFVCKNKPAEECNLIEVRRLLMQDLTELTKIFHVIASNDFEPMAEKAKSFLKASKTIEAVIFTAKTQLGFLHDDYLIDSLSVCSENHIDFGTMRQSEHKNVTVYLIVPIDRISNYQKWFRMVVHTALTMLRTEYKTAAKKVLVIVDECSAIGYLPVLQNSLAYARGFGIQIWCFFQNYEQIKALYPNQHEFFANVDIQQFFTVNDYATAEWISKRMGHKTVLPSSANYHPSGRIQSFSQSETSQLFFNPNELFGFDINNQILFYFGSQNPIQAVKDFYFNNPTLKKRADWNPYSLENQYDLFNFN